MALMIFEEAVGVEVVRSVGEFGDLGCGYPE